MSQSDRPGALESLTPERGGLGFSYGLVAVVLGLAIGFPFALGAVHPDLMLRRGWEQFAGTSMFLGALLLLGRELYRLWRNESAFASSRVWLERLDEIPADDTRMLPSRLRQLAGQLELEDSASTIALVELSRESSALDQDRASGRFTIQRYILYLLPVIGFIGTVEGISQSLMNIGRVLPMVQDLPGFMRNLTSVTSSLQIAFDSTLLALFLSAILLLALTLVQRRSEVLLERVDGYIIENALPYLGRNRMEKARANGTGGASEAYLGQLAELRKGIVEAVDRLGEGFGRQVERFGSIAGRVEEASSTLDRAGQSLAPIRGGIELLGGCVESLKRLELVLAESAQGEAAGRESQLSQLRKLTAEVEVSGRRHEEALRRAERFHEEQLAQLLGSLRESIDLLHVGTEQGNALYRMIVNKLIPSPGLAARSGQEAA